MTLLALVLTTALGGLRAQPVSAMDQWRDLLGQPGLATFFSGLFNRLGVEIIETGEQFTVIHSGDRFVLEKGLSAQVDYQVRLDARDVASVLDFGADDDIDEVEAYRIVLVLFTPLTRASLARDYISNGLRLRLGGIDKVMHVYLDGPADRHIAEHTLLFCRGDWYVIPGIQGKATRVFTLSVQEALAFQRRMHEAAQGGRGKDWRAFRKWYVDWREGVSRRP